MLAKLTNFTPRVFVFSCIIEANFALKVVFPLPEGPTTKITSASRVLGASCATICLDRWAIRLVLEVGRPWALCINMEA